MERHIREALGVVDLSEIAAMNERNFKRRFTKATGDTPKEYLHRLRIEHAKHRLEHTSISIEGIADEVGYRDLDYYRQLFKQLAGMTPQAYRAKMRIALPAVTETDKVAA